MYFVVVLTFIAFSLVTIAAFSLQTSQLVTDVVSEVPLTVILLLVLCHPTRRTYRNRAASLALFTVLTLPFQKKHYLQCSTLSQSSQIHATQCSEFNRALTRLHCSPLWYSRVYNQLKFYTDFAVCTLHRVGQKTGPQTHDHNSVKS